MKNRYLKTLSLFLVTAAAISGCKSTDWAKVKYEVTPGILEVNGDSVAVAVKITIPPKIFIANTTVTATPSIKWIGGEKELKPIVFQGEKVKEGNGIKVNTEKGGTFSYKDKVAYQPEMKVSELVGKAVLQVKTKKKEVLIPKIAVGTITTPLMVMSDEKTMMGMGDLSKIPAITFDADIHFAINQSKVRTNELTQDDIKGMGSFLKKSRKEVIKEKAAQAKATKAQAAADKASANQLNNTIDSVNVNYFVKNVEIVASASIDGKQDFNSKLAQDRGVSTEKFVSGEMIKQNLPGSQSESFFKKSYVAEDWDGFKSILAASDIADKDKVLSVISSTADLDEREAQIRSFKKTWKEISSKVLPKSRKATIKVIAQKKAKTIEELSKLAATTPDSLSVEELVYAGTLTNDMAAKAAIYANVSRISPTDWRGYNNSGVVSLMQNKLDEAQGQFDKANSISPNNPVVLNNLGVVAMKRGDRKTAESNYIAAGTGNEPKYNLGNVYVKQGRYAEAVSNYGNAKSFNAALATMLSGNNDAALTAMEGSADNDTAMGYYLKAIISARKADVAGAVGNIKNAIAKDASLKDKAKEDLEFTKIKDNDAFKAAIQ